MYYEISEELAKKAKEANSFREYIEGKATRDYKSKVDHAFKLCNEQKEKVAIKYHSKIEVLFHRYAKKLALYTNKMYEIDARMPSVMIAGGGNFPIKQKEKQNSARAKNFKELEKTENILKQIQEVGYWCRNEKNYEIDLQPFKFKGGEVVDNKETNRLQIFFDDKPVEEVRVKLKKNGFKWAPSQKAWQRQLTPTAIKSLSVLDLPPLYKENDADICN